MRCSQPHGSTPRLSGLEGQTQFTVEDIVLDHLLELAAAGRGSGMSAGAAFPAGVSVPGGGGSGAASGQARAIALAEAVKLEDWLKTQGGSSEAKAHWAAGIAEIERFRKDPRPSLLPRRNWPRRRGNRSGAMSTGMSGRRGRNYW